MVRYITLIATSFVLSCSPEPTPQKPLEETSIIKAIKTKDKKAYLFEFGVIDYDSSSEYDTKLAYNDGKLLVLNYDLAHTDFVAATASLSVYERGMKNISISNNTDLVNSKYKDLAEYMTLQVISLTDFTEKSSAQIWNNRNFKFVYSQKGKTTLTIETKNGEVSHIISEEPHPGAPFYSIQNIQGNKNDELLVFYPTADYWDSKSYVCQVFDLKSFGLE